MIESLTKKSINAEQQIIYWRQHPVQAVKDIFDVDLDKHQRITFTQTWFNTAQTNILSRGTGKCVAPDTLVFTGQGMVRIGDLGSCPDGCTSPLQLDVQGMEGRTPATAWYNDGVQDGFHVVTDYGYEVKGTAAHHIVCWSAQGYIEKSLSEIVEGDIVVVPRGMDLFGDCTELKYDQPVQLHKHAHWKPYKLPTMLDAKLAYLLGLLVGDGTCGYEGFVVLTSGDEDMLEKFRQLCQELFALNGHNGEYGKHGERCPAWKLSSVPVRQFLQQIGLDLCGARKKRIPECILGAPRPIVAAFLRGLFDTDGGVDSRGMISYGTSSRRLADEVHVLLTNFGIISDLRYKAKVDAWEIEIGSDAIDVFIVEIGFDLLRKQIDEQMTTPKERNPNKDTIPMVAPLLREVKREAMRRGVVISRRIPQYQKLYAYINEEYQPSYRSLRCIIESLPELAGFEPYDILHRICKEQPFFDVVVSKTPFRGSVCDLVVPEGHLFCANGMVQHNTFLCGLGASLESILKPGYRVGLLGPSFRQSKLIWDEVEKLYQRSPIFQDSTAKPPTSAPDKCHMRLKAAPGKIGSVIEALPMGTDGGKIRGSRYFSRYIDEGAQVPKSILDIVVRGFGVTRPNPMEQVRMVEEQNRLVREGIISEEQRLRPPPNREIFNTTAFYQYNHSWERVSKLIEFLNQGKRKAERKELGFNIGDYIFRGAPLNEGQIPYRVMTDGKRGLCAFTCTDPSEGFIDLETINEAKREMSDYTFKMEFFCLFPPDSEGFFRRSVIDNARNQAEFGIVLKPRKGCLYAMGVDPARTSDNFSIAIFEIDPDAAVIRLVRVASWNKKDFPLCHRLTRQLIKDYEVEYFEMDAGGGGTTIRDLLASEENCPDGQKLILEQNFDEHKLKTGTRILGPLIQFSCYQWVHDANHNLLSGLQHGKLKIAAKSPMPIAPWNIWSAELEEAEEEMERALSEWASVVTTPLGSRLHWDTPTKTMRKDRYSAILIGFNAALRVLGENNKPTKLAAGFWMPAYGHMGR